MSAADTVSVVVAAVAVSATVVLVVLLARRRRSGAGEGLRPDPAVSTAGAAERATAGPAVSIRLIGDPASELVWRVAVARGAPPATVDILTYRPHGGAGTWCHELMDAPLILGSAMHGDLDGPPSSPADTFDVCLGWTTLGGAGSRYETVHAEPAD